jgi:heme-degrading monooxygenase HmoA
MILEVVISQIKAGQEAEFEEAHQKASQYLARATGYLGNELRRSVETKGRYVHLVKWESVGDHMEGFRASADFEEFRALIAPFYAAPTQMEHYELVYENPR